MAFGLINIDGLPFSASGVAPFQVLSADQSKPESQPWIIADARGENAIRFLSDDMRAVFEDWSAAVKVACAINAAVSA